MGAISIRQVDDDLKRRLRRRAADNGRSMEAEARAILRSALAGDETPSSGAALASRLRDRFAGLGAIDAPPRAPAKAPPALGEG